VAILLKKCVYFIVNRLTPFTFFVKACSHLRMLSMKITLLVSTPMNNNVLFIVSACCGYVVFCFKSTSSDFLPSAEKITLFKCNY